ncbi:MAG: hypothetical protein LBN18_00795 [Dysgonamonadaceae bacterium]|jgi:hypothetical protein|nr:hypothetical protein [Dysgonamonadaceae bacterium]
MKHQIIKFSIVLAFAFAPALSIVAGGDRVGLYNNEKNNTQIEQSTVSESIGVYKSNPDFDDSTDGMLRAGGNMGGGDGNKVPAGDGLLILLLAATGYICYKKLNKITARKI